MEEKIVRTNKENKTVIKEKYKLFEWQLVKEENNKLFFQRDNQTTYYSELVKLEKQYPNYQYPSVILFVITSIVAFLLVTVMLIMFLVNKELAKTYWWAFILPAGIFLIITVLFTYLRMRTFSKIINEKPKTDAEFLNKINKVRNKE